MAIYIGIKKYLRNDGWQILGGQPPSGTDHLPVIEIKKTHGELKGSGDSFKPDLLALKEGLLMIFELKPRYSDSDVRKLDAVLKDPKRIENFWRELEERKIRTEDKVLVSSKKNAIQIACAVAYAGPYKRVSDLWTFLSDDSSGFKVIPPSGR